ncbi:Meiotic activator RIM4-like protein [Elsinoe fawcettii]|nr:Meiotic activator RIM4-like protein [Elsinoe fawcettii]
MDYEDMDQDSTPLLRRSQSCGRDHRPSTSYSTMSGPASLENRSDSVWDSPDEDYYGSSSESGEHAIIPNATMSLNNDDLMTGPIPAHQPIPRDSHFPTEEESANAELSFTTTTEPTIITSENAQDVLPPNACLFVANLPKLQTDMDIRAQLEQEFIKYGTVYGKVRRDQTRLPVAFVQYTDRGHAQAAKLEAKGKKIGGRVIRIEFAKCERTLFCSHKLNDKLDAVDVQHIQTMLEGFGPVEDITRISADQQSLYYLPKGVWCRFKLYGACQDAFKKLFKHDTYRFELFRDNSPSLRLRPYPSSHIPRMPEVSHRKASHYARMKSYGHAARHGSIVLVDGLPTTTTKPQLEELFEQFGTITAISIQHVFQGDYETTPSWFYGYVCFMEEFAAPAVQAFSVRHGFCIQNAAQLCWSLLSIEAIFVQARPFDLSAWQSFDVITYHEYLHNRPHPMLYGRGDIVQNRSRVPPWAPNVGLLPFFEHDSLQAKAPGKGAKVTKRHARSVAETKPLTLDAETKIIEPRMDRQALYTAAQRFPAQSSSSSDDTKSKYEPPSGLSPVR